MGQQQLLLVILVTILVGIATVVAINVFGTAAEQSNRDAVRQDLLAAVAQAQAVWTRPAAMGGFGQSFDPDNVTVDLRRLNIPRHSDPDAEYLATTITNDNGTYTIEEQAPLSITLKGEPVSGGPDILVTLTREGVDAAGDPTDADGGAWRIVWLEETS